MDTPYDLYNYQKYWQGRDYDFWSEREALVSLLNVIKNGKKDILLDAGAGFGRNASLYAGIFKKAILLDPSVKEIGEARVLLKEYSNLEYQIGTIEELPFPKDCFDCILCVRVLHHLENPESAISEFERILRPGGFLILEVANKINFKAKILALLKGNFVEFGSNKPLDKRSPQSKMLSTITFVNHNPEFIKEFLSENGFKIQEVLSVSNFRSPFSHIKALSAVFLFLDKILYRPLARVWFGPSIIFLAKKED